MPINPAVIENPYGLPPLNDEPTLTDEERRRLGMRVDTPASVPFASGDQTTEEARLEMMRSIAAAAQRPGANQQALSVALSAASRAVPQAEWRPEPERLTMGRKQAMKAALDFRTQQQRILQQYASDPRNPIPQSEVQRIMDQIDAEAVRALEAGVMPTPVSMYETLVEQDSPEVIQAKTKENLLTIPGFKPEWSAFVTFDENNQPVYPKWMEKPMEAAMSRAMGVAEEEEDPALEEAFNFQEAQWKSRKPKPSDYENGAQSQTFQDDLRAWQNEGVALVSRYKPEVARHLPTFAEEMGFAGATPAPAPAPATAPAAPSPAAAPPTDTLSEGAQAGFFNPEDVDALRIKLGVEGVQPSIMESLDHVRGEITAGRLQPGDTFIISKPSGAFAFRLKRNGKLVPIGRHSSQRR